MGGRAKSLKPEYQVVSFFLPSLSCSYTSLAVALTEDPPHCTLGSHGKSALGVQNDHSAVQIFFFS